ncbi:MAG: hypothetical protein ACK55H_14500 [Cyanobacteriota bacterium]
MQADIGSLFPSGPRHSEARLDCVAGVDSPGSTSLKWGEDGELTALDLHNLLARLSVHDPEVCRAMPAPGADFPFPT